MRFWGILTVCLLQYTLHCTAYGDVLSATKKIKEISKELNGFYRVLSSTEKASSPKGEPFYLSVTPDAFGNIVILDGREHRTYSIGSHPKAPNQLWLRSVWFGIPAGSVYRPDSFELPLSDVEDVTRLQYSLSNLLTERPEGKIDYFDTSDRAIEWRKEYWDTEEKNLSAFGLGKPDFKKSYKAFSFDVKKKRITIEQVYMDSKKSIIKVKRTVWEKETKK